jgi:hypothetical protein
MWKARALAVFETSEAARNFLRASDPGPGWAVVDDPDGDLVELLGAYAAPRGVRYVTIDPPAATQGDPPPAVSLIPIERFLEYG